MFNIITFCQYIQNAGGKITIEKFVEDWVPVGEKVISQLKEMRVIQEVEGVLYLTEEGKELVIEN